MVDLSDDSMNEQQPEYQVVIRASFNKQQAEDIATILKHDHFWIATVEEVVKK